MLVLPTEALPRNTSLNLLVVVVAVVDDVVVDVEAMYVYRCVLIVVVCVLIDVVAVRK